MNAKQALRQKLFRHGSSALARARPLAPSGLYACPICLLGHTDPDAFTLEHVPPKSAGGRPLVLTCPTCNNTAGRELDSHIAAAKAAAAIAAGQRPLDTALSFGGHQIRASILFGEDGLDITGIPARSNPREQEAFLAALNKAANEQTTDHSFNLSYRDPYDPWRETVAWLRVGYLYAFATLGYNYILQPALAPIRDQIRSPEQELVPHLVKRVTPHEAVNTLHFVSSPEQFRSIVVLVADRFVVLPDFETPSTLTARTSTVPLDQWPKTFSGPRLSLPKSPLYLADFRLAALLRTVSPYHSAQSPDP